MSNNIGSLYVKEGRNGPYLSGQVRVMDYAGPISLQAVQVKRSENSPDYNVYGKSRNGEIFDLGGAWIKTPKKGGAAFLSITLDAPGFAAGVNCTAFPNDENGAPASLEIHGAVFDIVWRRPRRQAGANQGGADQAGAGADQGEGLDDEIPF